MRAIYALLLIFFLGIVVGSVQANNENVCNDGYGPPGYYQDDYPESSLNIFYATINCPVYAIERVPDLHMRYMPAWTTLNRQPITTAKLNLLDPEVSYTYIGDSFNSTTNVSNNYKILYAYMEKSSLTNFEYSMRL